MGKFFLLHVSQIFFCLFGVVKFLTHQYRFLSIKKFSFCIKFTINLGQNLLGLQINFIGQTLFEFSHLIHRLIFTQKNLYLFLNFRCLNSMLLFVKNLFCLRLIFAFYLIYFCFHITKSTIKHVLNQEFNANPRHDRKGNMYSCKKDELTSS